MLRGRTREQRGAVALEMAIVAPVLVLLVFGMLEFGLAFSTKLGMSNAVNQATRHATILGTADYADRAGILQRERKAGVLGEQ